MIMATIMKKQVSLPISSIVYQSDPLHNHPISHLVILLSKNSFESLFIFICVFLFLISGAVEGVECIGNGKFYRNPEFKDGVRDCAKYYWCPRGKVLEFRCSSGLWFDIERQICDFKSKIPTSNCEKSHGKCPKCPKSPECLESLEFPKCLECLGADH